MTTIPEPQAPKLVDLIDQSHEMRSEKPRPHMGASQIGHHCDRWLWLSFRWAASEKFKGRILRIFRRGHHEENFVVADLRAAGLHITDTGGSQARVDFGNHVSGSIDGIIHSGVPEAPGKPHILEIKTHSDKSFREVCAKGVEKSKPVHWAQMQVYMLGKDIDRALYVAVNKNDDHIYTERIKLDKAAAQSLVEKAHRIVSSDRMPEPCTGASPDWYLCKFCPAFSICHEGQPTQHTNCRTCAHSTAETDGTWTCAKWGDVIPTEYQHTGCESHVLHPDLVPWQLDASASTEHVAAWRIGDGVVLNGAPAQGVYSSRELLDCLDAAIQKNEKVDSIRMRFDARLGREA